MPQPIEEGTVLGGRYRVTGHVVTSADQDMVLEGRDQVLNRDVTILVASAQHAAQVATSARELATGERTGEIQVLDLGLSDGRTYLIASGDSPTQEMLDLGQAQQVYVEPFYTDTLGSELFGESRTYEPQVYEDDEDYYSDLDAPVAQEETSQRRPKFLNRISEQLNRRLGTADGAAGAGAAGAGTAAAAASTSSPDDGSLTGEHPLASGATQRRYDEEFPLPEQVEDDFDAAAEDEHAQQTEPDTPDQDAELPRQKDHSDKVTVWEDEPEAAPESAEDGGLAAEPDRQAEDDSFDESVIDPAPEAPAVHGAPEVSSDPDPDEDQTTDRAQRPTEDGVGLAAGGTALAAGAAAAGAGSSRASWGDFLRGGSSSERSAEQDAQTVEDSGPEHSGEQPDRPVAPVQDTDEDYQYADDEDRDRPGAARWLMAGILALLLVLAGIIAFNLLGNNLSPTAGPTDQPTQGEESPSPTSSEEAPTSDLPAPAIAGVSRFVPDSPTLSADTDSTLPNAIDGNPATAWQTYSFAQPTFGGYATSMALVVELEETSAVNELAITQNSGSGGSFSVLVGPSEDISEATQIAEGSFTGPQISIPITQDGGPAEGQYVFINFTELPRLANGTSTLPYGLRVAEVQVN